jgi:hypothetical protein
VRGSASEQLDRVQPARLSLLTHDFDLHITSHHITVTTATTIRANAPAQYIHN